MRCAGCDAETFADSLFCSRCGRSLTRPCDACDAENPSAARFCRRCGAALHADGDERGHHASAASAGRVAAEGELRHLTVMFCDLVESTALGEELDPEELHDVVSAYQGACAEVIARHGGYVAQYAGDGLLVYFGYPVAHENDAERAIDAGLDILPAIAALNVRLEASRGIRLALRIGIHSGPVVVAATGGGDPRDRQVLGHTVNLAARLQAAAEPDTVVTTEATLRLARGFFVAADMGTRRLKGIAEPVAIHRVVGRSGARTRLEGAAVATGLTPFTGREEDVALLVGRFQEAAEGNGQVMLLSGEPGIGKSRLVQVFRERIAGESHRWLEGHCSPYHEHSAFRPVIDLLDHVLRLHPDRTAAQKTAALERALAPTGLPLAIAVPLFAALLSLPKSSAYEPLRLSAEGQRQRTLEMLIGWLVSLCARQPVVVVVEDLHWIDPSTRELLGMLVEQCASTRMLLLLTARPGFEVPWPSRSNVTHLTLQPLPRRHVAVMIERLARGRTVPAEVCAQVIERTDGVPLFVEELTKAVLESELVAESVPSYGRAYPRPVFTVPSTLRDSLAARLDRLGPAKEVAQLGAVLGREFSHELLHAVARPDPAFVDEALSELARAELVYPRGVAPRITYRFKHALIQDAAYGSLLRSRRQEAHARIAHVLRERFPERVQAEPEELARHCAEAGEIVEAARCYGRAGERAAERSAHAEAVGFLTRGLELASATPAGPERDRLELELRVALGFPLVAQRGYGDVRVEETYERARVLCQSMKETPRRFEAVWGLANYYQSRGMLDLARELSEELVTIADRAGDARLSVWAHLQLGGALFFRGDAAAARPHLELAVARHDPGRPYFLTGAPEPGISARAYAGWALNQLGLPARALRTSEEGLELARTAGHPFTLALVLYFHSALHQSRHEPERARVLAEETIAVATAQQFPLWQGLGRVMHGWALSHLDRATEGLDEIQRGLVQLSTTGTEVGASGGFWLLADASRMAGRLDEALDAVDTGLTLAEQGRQYAWDPELHWLKAEILAALAERAEDEPERWFRMAVERARTQQKKMFELRAALRFARFQHGHGGDGEARRMLADVYGDFIEGFDLPDLRAAGTVLAGGPSTAATAEECASASSS